MAEKDFFRDTWVRYLGYANELGESFRPLVPVKVVHFSYGLAFAYVFADTAHKSYLMLKKDSRPSSVLVETGDALLWQTLASVVIPGYAINRLCAFSDRALCKYVPKLPMKARNVISVGICLASIPIIVKPIDEGCTALMDHTYRKVFSNK